MRFFLPVTELIACSVFIQACCRWPNHHLLHCPSRDLIYCR